MLTKDGKSQIKEKEMSCLVRIEETKGTRKEKGRCKFQIPQNCLNGTKFWMGFRLGLNSICPISPTYWANYSLAWASLLEK